MMVTGLRRWLGVALVLAVMAGGVLATALATLGVSRIQQEHAALLMDHNADAIQRAVANEASRYTETLADMTAAVGSQTSFNATDFDAITSRLTRDRLRGASTVGFVVSARAAEAPAVQRFWRGRGADQLSLRTVGNATDHLYLIYNRSLDQFASVAGRDLSQAVEPAEAMRLARASGQITASHPYVLIKDRDLPVAQRQQSFLLAAPVIGAKGTPTAGDFLGWMILSMRGGDFVEETLHAYVGELLKVTLSDLDHERVSPFASTTTTGALLRDTDLRRERSVLVGEHDWRITIEPTVRLLSDTDRRLPGATLTLGLLVTVLAGVLADSRRRALREMAKATAALRNDIERRKAVEARLLEREDELRHLAMHDALTSLPNRTLFHERLEERLGRPLAVFFVDLDGFKAVNDGLGHGAGDQLLVEAAQRLLECARAGDTVARLGGDEFAILAADPAAVEPVAERIVSSLRTPFDLDGQPVTISCSVGVAVSTGGPAGARHLVHTADAAMYAAKAAGKNRYTVAVTETTASLGGRPARG